MVWFRRWKGQLTWDKVSEYANLLFWLGVMMLVFGAVLSIPVLGWSGVGMFVLSLVVLAWSDTFLPDYEAEKEKEKEARKNDKSVW
jgi:membrane-bound ClpP family serine protease